MIEIFSKYRLNGDEFYNGREVEIVLRNNLTNMLGRKGADKEFAEFLITHAKDIAPILSDIVLLEGLRMKEANQRILERAKELNW